MILVGITIGIMYLMLHGWNARTRKIDIEALPELPAETDEDAPTTSGIYVTSTLAGQPYERVTAQGLGVKAAVDVVVREDGVLLRRQGADDLFIPRLSLHQIGRTAGMIGKFAAPGSIVVIRWKLDDLMLDTGIHVRSDAPREILIEQLTALIDEPSETARE